VCNLFRNFISTHMKVNCEMKISKSIGIIKSLADNSRLMIVNSLLESPQYVEELAERLNLASSTVSFHLKKLESADLVRKRKDQYYVIYSVNEDILGLSIRELISFKNFDKYLQDERLENYRKKVIKTFFKDGRLTKLPAQWKKKLIVMDTFKAKFSSGKIYAESQVDALLKQSCDDHCAIRRMLVDTGFFTRENGLYQVKTAKPPNPEVPHQPSCGERVW